MDIKELRIGNYIKWVDGDWRDIVQIEAISRHGDLSAIGESVYCTDIQFCSPIPLTEEWLIDFGFDKSEESSGPPINSVWEVYEKSDLVLTRFVDHRKGWMVCEIHPTFDFELQNVHQLQNLYYALTGTELTKKE